MSAHGQVIEQRLRDVGSIINNEDAQGSVHRGFGSRGSLSRQAKTGILTSLWLVAMAASAPACGMRAPPRQLVLASILVVVAAVGLGTGLARRAWVATAGWLEPWQRGMARGSKADAAASAAEQLREQVARMTAENVVLRRRLDEYAAIQGEGKVGPRQAVVARGQVVARTLRQGRRFCELDVGAVDGVETGMAVAVGWSLVGVVSGVQPSRCLVRQITDRESRVPAAVFADSDLVAEGVLAGTGSRGTAMLEFVEDRPGLQLAPGMHVMTAAFDPNLPPGMVLGVITAADRSAQSAQWRIDVAPLRDAEVAESLLVIRTAPVTPPAP
jgi:cell shape-determining protein MreC